MSVSIPEKFRESELVLNKDGSLYHLCLHPEEIADTIILVGDPGRVPIVSSYFDTIEVKKQNREMITHTGYYQGKRLTVLSTGMGTDNIDICMAELDALVNIDLNERVVKERLTQLNFVRLGTTATLQADIPIDSFIVSTHAIGLDTVMHYYDYKMQASEMTQALREYLGDDAKHLSPYMTTGSKHLVELFADSCIQGITATCAGFYAPQGRKLRYQLALPNLIDKLADFSWHGQRVVNLEMETAGIYGLGHEVLNHHCCSLSLVAANRASQTVSSKAEESMHRMIEMSLDKLANLA